MKGIDNEIQDVFLECGRTEFQKVAKNDQKDQYSFHIVVTVMSGGSIHKMAS